MAHELQQLQSWLGGKLDSGRYPFLQWRDKSQGVFTINWTYQDTANVGKPNLMDELCEDWAAVFDRQSAAGCSLKDHLQEVLELWTFQCPGRYKLLEETVFLQAGEMEGRNIQGISGLDPGGALSASDADVHAAGINRPPESERLVDANREVEPVTRGLTHPNVDAWSHCHSAVGQVYSLLNFLRENVSMANDRFLQSWMKRWTDSGRYPCLQWKDKDQGVFTIDWNYQNTDSSKPNPLDKLCEEWARRFGSAEGRSLKEQLQNAMKSLSFQRPGQYKLPDPQIPPLYGPPRVVQFDEELHALGGPPRKRVSAKTAVVQVAGINRPPVRAVPPPPPPPEQRP